MFHNINVSQAVVVSKGGDGQVEGGGVEYQWHPYPFDCQTWPTPGKYTFLTKLINIHYYYGKTHQETTTPKNGKKCREKAGIFDNKCSIWNKCNIPWKPVVPTLMIGRGCPNVGDRVGLSQCWWSGGVVPTLVIGRGCPNVGDWAGLSQSWWSGRVVPTLVIGWGCPNLDIWVDVTSLWKHWKLQQLLRFLCSFQRQQSCKGRL